MRVNHSNAHARSLFERLEKEYDQDSTGPWVPAPKVSRPVGRVRPDLIAPEGPARPDIGTEMQRSDDRVVSLGFPAQEPDRELAAATEPSGPVRFGFAGSDDRVVSLSVPVEATPSQAHVFQSFEIEYDPEQPDRLTLCLFEADEDSFIHTVQKSVSFPAQALADLLSRRRATPEETAAWYASTDEDE